MTKDDQAALAKMGKVMGGLNGYVAMQSSGLYVTDGDEIDWAYAQHRIFMYTFELYPSHSQVSSNLRFYPPDEVIERETTRNRTAILYLIDRASCVYDPIGKAASHCGPFFDDVEVGRGWTRDPLGTDTATGGAWQRGDPAATTYQAGTTPSGRAAFVTGTAAGTSSAANDLDGGVTTLRSVPIVLPATVGKLTFRYYLAHNSSSSAADWFRAYVEDAEGVRTVVRQELGDPATDTPSWASATVVAGRLGRADHPDRVRGTGREPGRDRRGGGRRHPGDAALDGGVPPRPRDPRPGPWGWTATRASPSPGGARGGTWCRHSP